MFRSLKVNYNNTRTEMCKIGSKYDTDKSSQRLNPDSTFHCHPYTCFYHSLFRNHRHTPLRICELGILHGASLRMWREYFYNVKINAFEYYTDLINIFKATEYDDIPESISSYIPPIEIETVDVTSRASISQQFAKVGHTYDLIIEDTTHLMPDQINVIFEVLPYMKPGGMLIIEDIFRRYDEAEYKRHLEPILHEFQDIYFVTLDHQNRISDGWDNDKLLVLIKAGAPPIFKNQKRMTIITPSIRPENIPILYNSINFDYVDKWHIVYDGKKIATNPHLYYPSHPKIVEHVYTGIGTSGNPQRNYALDLIDNMDTYVYFLDDDNVIHPSLYHLLDIADDKRIYTFDSTIRPGNNLTIGKIDTAQFLADYSIISNIRWVPHIYISDGIFIEACHYTNTDKWIYVNHVMANYNILQNANT